MAKKRWRAKRAITLHLDAGEEFEKEYSEEEEELLLARDVLEEVQIPIKKAPVAPVTKKKEDGDGKN